MTTAAITTITKMMELLPEPTQDQVVEHLRDYIAEMKDEARWDMTFKSSQEQLVKAARRAKQEITAGRAEPMSYNQL
ncbi:MAG TPA: hypothetical protein G4N96_04490 [Chloroflexi bacterium]|nr:MAG: hypothetical protein B6243_06460 [Anaerolineaceae bacterium 4572_5.2]HEY84359.1 hypothetical protein [Chloroflexota bacterium]